MLSIIIFTPIVAAAFLVFTRDNEGISPVNVALAGSGLPLALALGVAMSFDPGVGEMQFVETYSWVSTFNINFQVGVDGVSLWMLVLTAFLSFIAIIVSLDMKDRRGDFLALMLLLEAGTLGVFLALDTILFYVFWELMLVPTYFLIGLWGEGRRVYATIKFVLFTLVGSLLMLVAILSLTVIHFKATHELTFDIRTLTHTHIPTDAQGWMFVFFFLAFAIKIPIFPFHSWLPHAYMASPIPVLILLTGAMSKTGAYGLIRFCLPLFPDAFSDLALVFGGLAAVGIVYGAWIAIAQKDLKALVAWSSVSHLGFIALGIFAMNGEGIDGSVLQMVNHGIIASALFIIVGILEKKTGTRNLAQLRGLKGSMPVLYGVFMLIALAALGLPGLNGFVGEFLILMGVWTSASLVELSTIYVLMGGLAIVFAAIYMLFMFQGAMQEKPEKLPDNLTDIGAKDFGVLLPACILVVFIGLFPKIFMDRVAPSVDRLLTIEKTVNLPTQKDSGQH